MSIITLFLCIDSFYTDCSSVIKNIKNDNTKNECGEINGKGGPYKVFIIKQMQGGELWI